MMRSDLHDIEVIFRHRTERAVCIRASEDGPDVWLPLAQCEIAAADGGSLRRGCLAMLTARESILIEKDLV